MIRFVTGNLLQSDAECLVNTVNCEGFMGKGIAYQFKMQYPENNEDYIKACRNKTLRIGTLHHFRENGKIIINFPTKNKWREKSKIEYIEKGLDKLIELIDELDIKSISIPPLGSGNGGLIWAEVKKVIEDKLLNISDKVDVNIYEPSASYSSIPVVEPKLSASALVLMDIKARLRKFDKLRLQKAAYFVDLFSNKRYFNFSAHKFGPYDHAIEIISKNIKEFQKFHGIKDTNEAKRILYNKIISENVNNKLAELDLPIKKACDFVNKFTNDEELECLSTICYLLDKNKSLTEDLIIKKFKLWSEDKANRFSENDILYGIDVLYKNRLIEKDLMNGYILNFDKSYQKEICV